MLPIFALGLLLFVIGLVPFWTRRARGRRLRHTPRTLAADARPGTRVKVTGVLHVEVPVQAPLSGKACAFYRVSSSRREWEEVSGREVQVLHDEMDYAQGWFIQDESGRLAVDPTGATLVGTRVRDGEERVAGESQALREERFDLGGPVVALGRVAAGPRGPVLVGGLDLELFEGLAHENTGFTPVDLFFAMLMAVGLVLGGAAVSSGFAEPPVPAELSPITPLRPPQGTAPSR